MTESRPMSVYTGPAEVSWEQAAVEVLVYGRTEVIGELEGDWQTVFRRGGEVARELRQAAASLGSWHGAAGEVYRQRLTDLAARVDQVEADCGAIVPALAAARQSLATAQEAMPVPSEAVDNLAWARMKGDGAPLGSGFFMAAAQRTVAGGVTDLGAGLSDEVRDWFTNEEAKARQVHATVNGAYEEADANAPKPAAATPGIRVDATDPAFGAGPGGAGGRGVGVGGASGADVGRMPSAGPAAGAPSSGDGVQGLRPGSGADIGGEAVATPAGGPHGATSGSMMPSGGGLSGLGAFGGVGAAGAGTSGSGVVGVAAGGTGALGAGLGTAVSPAFGGVPLPPGGSGAARPGARSGGAAAKGAGPLGGMPGLVGSAAQRSARGEDADRSTWLLEDEDVWGTDSGAPPSVLGREKP
jgi:hypothetical protein